MIDIPTAPWAHLPFDFAAWVSSLGLGTAVARWRLAESAKRIAAQVGPGYFVALACGAIPAAWMMGSFNTLRSSAPTLSHSVAGALVGAIAGVEVYKRIRRMAGSTGTIFVAPFTLGIVIGRFGCLFSGLPDATFGAPTALPWAVNLGDGIGRHPVQLYESLAMALFLALYLVALRRRRPWALQRGFYAMCVWYGAQRFVWEAFKPYPPLVGPLNLFQILCGGLIAYGWIYWRRDLVRERGTQDRALFVPGPDHEPL